MARMRWMSDSSGRTMAVCLRCDRELPALAAENFYCYCRSGGSAGDPARHDLTPAASRSAA
jgi:hypothetical protein